MKSEEQQELMPAITWDELADDDFVFRHEGYCLRVEQMRKKHWWWAVYFQNTEIGFDDPWAKTENEAKCLAEIYFLRHKFKRLLEQEQCRCNLEYIETGWMQCTKCKKYVPDHKTD